jgi:hypothetical protein
MSYCNTAAAIKGVFSWVTPKAISWGLTGQASESRVLRWQSWLSRVWALRQAIRDSLRLRQSLAEVWGVEEPQLL